jgi:hypothetical protein
VATIRTRIDRAQDLTVNTAEGLLTIEDLMAAVEAYLTGEPTTKVLWDFCRVDGAGILTEDMIRLQDMVRRLTPTATKRRVAVVVARDLGFGLSRMAGSQAEIIGVTADYYVTRSIEDAMAWLGVPME